MKNKKQNSNRGAALVTVIVAIAVIGAMGIMMLYVAYSNFMMKAMDKKAKDNFYTVESILDDVCVKVEEVMSEQYVNAYTTIISQYDSYVQNKTQSQMTQDLKDEFIVNMVTALRDGTNDTKYTLDFLFTSEIATDDAGNPILDAGGHETITQVFYNNSAYPEGSYVVESVDVGQGASLVNAYSLETYQEKDGDEITANGLILKNVHVSYTSKEGYKNDITTDIKITAPTVDFTSVSAMPSIGNFAYIAQNQITVSGNNSLTLNGDAYSGGITLQMGTGNNNVGSTEAVIQTTFDATNSSLLVSQNNIDVSTNGTFKTGTNTSFWTNGIDLSGYDNFELKGRTYVLDDTTINGKENNVNLGVQYIGYSSAIAETDVEKSSALIINGIDTNLDMSELTTLVLAGTAFVSTKGQSYQLGDGTTMTTENNVMLGDSIAVKGNQLAYLVPTEGTGLSTNPLSAAQYAALPANWKETALNGTIPFLNTSLSAFGSAGRPVGIKEVFYTTINNNKEVYLYIDFPSQEAASQYFMRVYGSDSKLATRLNNYIDRYVDSISFSNDGISRLITNGNYLQNVTEEEVTDIVYSGITRNTSMILSELDNYKKSFSNLCSTLSTTTSGSGDVYDYLIDNSKVDAYLGTDHTKKTTQDGITVVVTDGTGTNINGIDYYPVAEDTGVIISKGNVYISARNFTGVIICDGEILTFGNTILNADETVVSNALNISIDASNQLYSLFVGGANYVSDEGDSTEEFTDIRKCLSFENYNAY